MLGIGSEKRGCFTLHNFSQICILNLSYLVPHYTFGSTCIKFMFAMNYGKSETSLFGVGVRFTISYPLLSGTFRSTTRQNRRPELQNVKKQCEFKRLKKPTTIFDVSSLFNDLQDASTLRNSSQQVQFVLKT